MSNHSVLAATGGSCGSGDNRLNLHLASVSVTTTANIPALGLLHDPAAAQPTVLKHWRSNNSTAYHCHSHTTTLHLTSCYVHNESSVNVSVHSYIYSILHAIRKVLTRANSSTNNNGDSDHHL